MYTYRRLRFPVEQAYELAGIDLEEVRQKTKKIKGKGRRARGNDSGIAADDVGGVSKVILVGGSTRIPSVRRLIQNMTGLKADFTVNPDEAVALGAAIQAGILEGQLDGISVMDVWQSKFLNALGKDFLNSLYKE